MRLDDPSRRADIHLAFEHRHAVRVVVDRVAKAIGRTADSYRRFFPAGKAVIQFADGGVVVYLSKHVKMALGIARMAYALAWSMPNFYDHTGRLSDGL